MQIREPVARPLDVIIAELLVTVASALLAASLLYLASGFWQDSGVAGGPVVVVLGLLGITLGGGWLYWLLGGTGWPLAAAAAPVALFSAFALLLGLQGGALISLDPWFGMLMLVAAGYVLVAGIFLDSPRRWRWDQRQRLRPGTQVPRVSPTSRRIYAAMPRSLGKRRRRSVAWGRAASTAPRPATAPASPGAPPDVGADRAGTRVRMASPRPPTGPTASGPRRPQVVKVGSAPDAADDARAGEDDLSRSATDGAETPAPAKGPAAADAGPPPVTPWRQLDDLPTSVEPRAQRSPWAWASPPEWNRQEDDDEPALDGGSSR